MAERSSLVSFVLFSLCIGLCAGRRGKAAFRQGVEVRDTGTCITWPNATVTTPEEYYTTDLEKSQFGLCSLATKDYPDGWLASHNSRTGKVMKKGNRPPGLSPSGDQDANICTDDEFNPCCGLENKCIPKNRLTSQLGSFKKQYKTKPKRLVNARNEKMEQTVQHASNKEMVCCEKSSAETSDSDLRTSKGVKYDYSRTTRGECEATRRSREASQGHWGARVLDKNEEDKCSVEGDEPSGRICGVSANARSCGLTQLENCAEHIVPSNNGPVWKTGGDMVKKECYMPVEFSSGCGTGFISDQADSETLFSAERQYFAKLTWKLKLGEGSVEATLCAAGGLSLGRAGVVDTAKDDDDGKVVGDFKGMQVIGGLSKSRGIHFSMIDENKELDAHTDKDTVKEIFFGANTDFNLKVSLKTNAPWSMQGKQMQGNPREEYANKWTIVGASSPIWIPNLDGFSS